MTQKELESIAKEYLDGNISLKDLAASHSMGKSTLIDYFKGKKSVVLSTEMQKQIDAKKTQRWIESKATYGNKGNFSLTKEEAQVLATSYIAGDELALRDMAAVKKVSVGTIYNSFTQENLGCELYEQVKEKYENKYKNRGKTGL